MSIVINKLNWRMSEFVKKNKMMRQKLKVSLLYGGNKSE